MVRRGLVLGNSIAGDPVLEISHAVILLVMCGMAIVMVGTGMCVLVRPGGRGVGLGTFRREVVLIEIEMTSPPMMFEMHPEMMFEIHPEMMFETHPEMTRAEVADLIEGGDQDRDRLAGPGRARPPIGSLVVLPRGLYLGRCMSNNLPSSKVLLHLALQIPQASLHPWVPRNNELLLLSHALMLRLTPRLTRGGAVSQKSRTFLNFPRR